jgi:UDP-N-acetylmuramate dehydrogenase
MKTDKQRSLAVTKCGLFEVITSDRLSFYRTQHQFRYFGEFATVEEFLAFSAWARGRSLPVLIVGAGSNLLFIRRRISTVVLKNRLPRMFRVLDARTVEVSSSVMVAEVLKWCETQKVDSFYYLASVPATVGGAVAMNAGRGQWHNLTIFDFVESVTYVDGDHLRTVTKDEIVRGYRETPFTGLHANLIVSVVFAFPDPMKGENPRRERIAWSKANQDNQASNCGSVFKQWDPVVMHWLRRHGVRIGGAGYSRKTINWIANTGEKAWPIVCLIRLTQALHRLRGKRAILEVIEVK